MKLTLRTKVKGNYKNIMSRFDLKLFEALKPPGVKMEVIKFTGSKKGDVVELEFLFPLKSKWISDITADDIDEQQAYFIDEGRVLPFPLRHWQHKHIVEKIDEDHSWIIDDINFSTGFKFIDPLLYLPLLISFYPRKKIYRSYFVKGEQTS